VPQNISEPIPKVDCSGDVIVLNPEQQRQYKELLEILNNAQGAMKAPPKAIVDAVRDTDLDIRRKLACEDGLKKTLWKGRLLEGRFTDK
jgi:hypothetical protein